jgi:predicted nuclease of restriction endonuclease-like (RecB) superfamily
MKKLLAKSATQSDYSNLIATIGELVASARQATARVANSFMTATYWEVGRRIVEFEQGGRKRAEYGKELLQRLAVDLTARCGRGFSAPNLHKFRQLYIAYPPAQILSAASMRSGAGNKTPRILSTVSIKSSVSVRKSRNLSLRELSAAFPLPWSAYVRLLSVKNDQARRFYESEALRGGWSIRQPDRQINSLFYERTALSQNKTLMLKKGARPHPGDALTADEAIRDPLVLEFLNLRDEYSETELEATLIQHLETFLLELGGDFAFVGRQRRLRIDDEWYRVDLLFFHRRLRCLVIVDLKLGKFNHADAGQMHLYVNYARQHWTHPDENPPVGVILCSSAGESMVRYTLEDLPNKVLAREYRLALPAEGRLQAELDKARSEAEQRFAGLGPKRNVTRPGGQSFTETQSLTHGKNA